MRLIYFLYKKMKFCNQYKKFIALIFCAAIFFLVRLVYNYMHRLDVQFHNKSEYFIDTPGCRMPYLPTYSKDMDKKYIWNSDPVLCRKPLTRPSEFGTAIIINMNEKEILENYKLKNLENIICFLYEFQRKTDFENQFRNKTSFKLTPNSRVNARPGVEFVFVECVHTRNNKTFYQDVHFFVYDKLHLEKPVPGIKDNATDRPSVMIFGHDSLSHLNFLRKMKNTAAYIHQNLSHFEYWGYNKVGDNTLPNLLPVLIGLTATEFRKSCPKNYFIDHCDFLWKKYKKAGFQTVFAEDDYFSGLFSFYSFRFKTQPTDYYLLPALRTMERHIWTNHQECVGGRRTVDVLMEYIRKLVPYLSTQNFFSYFWSSTFTHNYFNYPALIDNDVVRIFEIFEKASIFNKTIIFFISDHGLRFGKFRRTYQGAVEERLPLFMVFYPQWFRQKYSLAMKNMELNAKRLTTHFDLHETLLDLLDLNNLEEKNLQARSADIAKADTLPRGMSLFLPIPTTRTCNDASVTVHWCTCNEHTDLPTTDIRAQHAAIFLVQTINSRLKVYPQCHRLQLKSILNATIASPNRSVLNETSSDTTINIMVRIETRPGLAVFESTLIVSKDIVSLPGGISRTNLYGEQSYCVDKKELKMFCYC